MDPGFRFRRISAATRALLAAAFGREACERHLCDGSGGMYRSTGNAALLSMCSSSIGRKDSVELCFFFFNCSEVWDNRMNLAFCSATWAVRVSSFDSQEGMLSVRCVKLSRGVTDLDMLEGFGG